MNDSKQTWLNELEQSLGSLDARERRRQLRPARVVPQHQLELDGRVYLNLASNDYLGLGCDLGIHRQFAQHVAEANELEQVGFTASASRLLGGEHPQLAMLEHQLNEAYGDGRVSLLFNSGYHANIGILPALAAREDLILSDRLVHASLIDGIRLCRSRWIRYRHGDLDHVRDLLVQHRDRARRIFIVTESVFSMDGDLTDVRALVALASRYGAVLYLDEAHAVGVLGPHGLGLSAEQGVRHEVDILVGTFGKALASTGAFAIVPPSLRDYLINKARSLIFTTAMPPINAGWTRFVLQKSLEADDRRRALRERTALFREAAGLPSGSHIVPLVVGPDAAAVALSRSLREQGYWVPPIRPPTVPEGTARLRFSLGACMPRDRLEALALAARRAKETA